LLLQVFILQKNVSGKCSQVCTYLYFPFTVPPTLFPEVAAGCYTHGADLIYIKSEVEKSA